MLFAIPRTVGLAGAVGGDAARPGAEDRPAAAGLRRAPPRATTCREDSARECGPLTAALRGPGAAAACQTPAASAATAFDSSGRWSTCGSWWPSARGRRARPAIQQTRDYIEPQLTAIGLTAAEQAFGAQTPFGASQMVNLIATHSRRAPRAHPHHRPLRHQAVPRVPVRRRQRRRVERGDADRTGARAEGAARTRSPSSSCSSTARRPCCPTGAARDNTYGSRYYVEAAKGNGSIASSRR